MKIFCSLFVLLLSLTGCSHKQSVEARLEEYAKKISKSFSTPNDVSFRRVFKTTENPLRAYVVEFETQDPNFKSLSDAATNKVSFAINTGRRLVWESKFCTGELRKILIEEKINLLSGQIIDEHGETQGTSNYR